MGVSVPGHRHGGACFGIAGEVHAVLGLGGGDGVVTAVQLDVGGLARSGLVHRVFVCGRGRGTGRRGHRGGQDVFAVRNVGCRRGHLPVAVGIGRGGKLVGAEVQFHLRTGLGRTLQLHTGRGFGRIDGVVGGDGGDHRRRAVGVHRERCGGGRSPVAGGIDGRGGHRVGAIGCRQFGGTQRGRPLAFGIHGGQLGGVAHFHFHRAVGLGRAGNGHTGSLLGGRHDVVVADGGNLGLGGRGVVVGQCHDGQGGALHTVQCTGHFQRVAVRQARGRQRPGGRCGRLQVHIPVAVGIGRGLIGDVLALVTVGVQPQRDHRARFGRAGNGGVTVVERRGGFERQRHITQIGGTGGVAAATATRQRQTQHRGATQAVEHGTDRKVFGGGRFGGLERGVVQHEGAVGQGAQRLGIDIGQHRGLLGRAQQPGIGLLLATIAHIGSAHADLAAVRGAADQVVAFQRQRGRLAATFHRNVLDDQVVVHLQDTQLVGVDLVAVRILDLELPAGDDLEAVLAGLELQMLDPAISRTLDIQSGCHCPVYSSWAEERSGQHLPPGRYRTDPFPTDQSSRGRAGIRPGGVADLQDAGRTRQAGYLDRGAPLMQVHRVPQCAVNHSCHSPALPDDAPNIQKGGIRQTGLTVCQKSLY